MLTDDFRDKLKHTLAQNPKEVVKEIEKNPQILNILLESDIEKVKYIKMNKELQTRLQQQSDRLKVTQGWLLGAGLLLLLSLMDSD